ncbi:hypothetical protein AMATHDRAFT_86106 [Amanita thiersii Skay4041]|uniref:ATP-dependent DNA helicase n=1 Tax=Amanita thiersii Skay4041 TaxID=703135 RepID=A0A2A9NNW0_9AGAR|nr:hypothetical protein AMATHDRAFT_86106 [Amanita thiersii Skay4041]
MGKSLCFQIPAIAAKHGISIIVSPLLALIKDQVTKLQSKSVAAAALSSETSQEEKSYIIQELSSGKPRIKLLYITPEKLCTNDFINLLKRVYQENGLNRLIIDEAHCISEWGHDFRAEYRRLGVFRERFQDVPIMALTATATPTVQSDIIRSLNMNEDMLFRALHPFNRENLFYEVRYTAAPDSISQMADICDYIYTLHRRRGAPSSGIVYCRTRATCDGLSAYLRGKGLNARPYHRGIKPHALDKTLTEWTNGGSGNGGVDVVIATIAFGLGIDKSDVRYIIHYDLPKSFEGYYQETGRAGRDGSPSKCILYYSREDAMIVRQWIDTAHSRRIANSINSPAPSQRTIGSLEALIQFAENSTVCRHVSICRYFGEAIRVGDPQVAQQYCNRMCDVCKYPEKAQSRKANLSSEEFAFTQISSTRMAYEQDDEDSSPSTRNLTSRKQYEPFAQPSRFQNAPPKRPEKFGNNRETKRAKLEMPPPLITKPFKSATSLTKPFKAPFFSNANDTSEDESQVLTFDDSDNRSDDEDVEMAEQQGIDDTSIDHHDNDCGFAAHWQSDPLSNTSIVADPCEDEQVELEASFSTKIPIDSRSNAYHAIRRSLHQICATEEVCNRLQCGPSSAAWLHKISKQIEFMAFSFSATTQGYKVRIRQRIQVIDALTQCDTWSEKEEDYEIAQEILDILKQNLVNISKTLGLPDAGFILKTEDEPANLIPTCPIIGTQPIIVQYR